MDSICTHTCVGKEGCGHDCCKMKNHGFTQEDPHPDFGFTTHSTNVHVPGGFQHATSKGAHSSGLDIRERKQLFAKHICEDVVGKPERKKAQNPAEILKKGRKKPTIKLRHTKKPESIAVEDGSSTPSMLKESSDETVMPDVPVTPNLTSNAFEAYYIKDDTPPSSIKPPTTTEEEQLVSNKPYWLRRSKGEASYAGPPMPKKDESDVTPTRPSKKLWR